MKVILNARDKHRITIGSHHLKLCHSTFITAVKRFCSHVYPLYTFRKSFIVIFLDTCMSVYKVR